MARKYDRYGYNRQFKAKPCRKRHPFPYPLPFIDDYSAANVLEKASAEPDTPSWPSGTPGMYYPPTTGKRTREQVEEEHAKRRKSNAARKLRHPDPLGKNVYAWTRKDTEMALMAAAAPWTIAAPMAAQMIDDIGVLRYGVRVAKKSKPKFWRGKVPDLIRTGKRRAKKIWYIAKSDNPGPRFIRFMGRQVMKKTKLH